jgi:pyruvate,orthophosphate dikinase
MEAKSSRALQVNLEDYRVEVTIDPKYHVIRDVMSKYDGLEKVINTFLEELCHPRRNWQFLTYEARTYSLGYFFDLKTHPKGHEAVRLYLEIAVKAIENAREPEVKTAAFNNFYLLIQKFIKESGEELERFLPAINYGFNEINGLPEEQFSFIAKNYYQLNRLAGAFLKNAPRESDFKAVNLLLEKYFEYTFSYWLSEDDPQEWFEKESARALTPEMSALFGPISHSHIKTCREGLRKIIKRKEVKSPGTLEDLLTLPGYGDVVDIYSCLPENIFKAVENEKLKHRFKLIFLFHTMNIPGLSAIHEDTLREINRDITWIISHEDIEHVQGLIQTTFKILQKSMDKFPGTVLKAALNMGKGIYETNESDLVDYFNEHVVRLGFQTPDFIGISDDWQIRSNLAHIQNIRTWMELIRLNPKWSKKLLSSLVINLSLGGVLIKDTDLFPRDITVFLNSGIQPVYNLVKQLMRIFPAYFNEIGAEGQLRDISSRIDDMYKRKDVLIHFLRKQSHVESSNKTVSLIEATLDFWQSGSKKTLAPFLPPNIYGQVKSKGPYVDGMKKIMNHIFKTKECTKVSDLLFLPDNYLAEVNEEFPEEYKMDIEKVALMLSFYKLLNQKYCVNACDLDEYIAQVQSTIPMKLGGLRNVLSMGDTFDKLYGILDYLQRLKELILSPDAFEVREDIYRKRHIAADIPSMYGSYRETKFDALGLTFRLESLANTLFEQLIEEFDLSFITHATFYEIYEYLKLFNKALIIDGIPAKEFKNQLDLLMKSLDMKLVTFTQYVDIFRGFTEAVRILVSNYFENIHKKNLLEISEYISADKLLPKYMQESESKKELFLKVSEIFLRDAIASSLGLQRLDLFLSRISNTLYNQAEKLPQDRHYLLLTYNPHNAVTPISDPEGELFDIIHLGNKSFNVIRMKNLGMPVPPGFVITTEVFRCRELIEEYPPANENFRKQIDREISRLEKETGKTFGSPDNALLISVRSGAAVSQPGMMDSYLNVGINESIVEGIIKQTGEGWFAWDCYRRFLQSCGMSFGLERDMFDAIITDFKKQYGVPFKKDLAPEQMKKVALAYKEFILSNNITIEESPANQLYVAIQSVLNSWNSEKSKTYRRIMGISDDWGTAVTVQKMVFGNLSVESGSGVLFTHSPKYSQDKLRPWGDYTIGNQGEDVVSGLVSTYPVSNYQASLENRPAEFSLENRFPEIYRALRENAKVLIYENQWAPQDIEFTFEGPQKKDLYLLQARNMDMKEGKVIPSFKSAAGMKKKFLGHGIGVSGGAMSGRVVFSIDDILHWGKAGTDVRLILVRGDTVPDDIKEISEADGLLTARGGATSHAAIVANRLNKTCVVGCRDLVCMEKEKKFILNQKVVKAGDYISINGSEGSIYLGKMEVNEKGE